MHSLFDVTVDEGATGEVTVVHRNEGRKRDFARLEPVLVWRNRRVVEKPTPDQLGSGKPLRSVPDGGADDAEQIAGEAAAE